VAAVVEDDLELALHHALVEPGAAEDEPAQPVHQRAVRRADQALPAGVHVLAEAGVRLLADLAVHRQVHQVLALLLGQLAGHELELYGSLLDALREVALVEREAELPVLEHVVGARLVVAASGGVRIHLGQ
jgi:hypothetical protein